MSASAGPDAPRPSHGRRVPRTTGDEREQAILVTFERLLEDRPLHEISVDDLARGAGISRPTFYFYFASKEAVLLSLFERMIADARAGRGDALEQIERDPATSVRRGITAFYETFRGHRAVTVAGADASATSAAMRDLWSRVMEGFVEETTAAIEAERARGAARDGPPARDLAITLLRMNERVLHTSFAGLGPAVAEEGLVEVLVSVWLSAIYG